MAQIMVTGHGPGASDVNRAVKQNRGSHQARWTARDREEPFHPALPMDDARARAVQAGSSPSATKDARLETGRVTGRFQRSERDPDVKATDLPDSTAVDHPVSAAGVAEGRLLDGPEVKPNQTEGSPLRMVKWGP